MYVLEGVREYKLQGSRALIASLIGALVTAVCSQIAFYLPGNPVPVTMQVFAVIGCGLVLGSRYAALAQIQYVAAGLLGMPVFAGFTAGPAVLAGPTGGYLAGFIVAAFIVGLFVERADNKSFVTACFAGLLGVGVIYTLGVGWLTCWLRVFECRWIALGSWALGAAPFVGFDVVKIVLAARLCSRR